MTMGQFVGNFNTRFLRWMTTLMLSTLLAACSVTSLGYNTLPSLLLWRVDGYFNLTDAQKTLVNERLAALLRWHRSNELPVYVTFLDEAEERLHGAPVDEATVARWRALVMQRWPVMAERMAPDIAELLLTLSPEQLARARRKLSEDLAKARKEYQGDDATRIKARVERYGKRAEFFLGSLSDAQEQYLRQIARRLPATEPHWLAEREARHERFFALMARLHSEKPTPAQASTWVKRYLTDFWTPADEERAAVLTQSGKASDQISAELLRLASPGQMAGMRKKLKGYSLDFARMASQ